MPNNDPFQATMRIDIPPDLQEQAEAIGRASESGTRRTGRTVIKIPRSKVEPSVRLGDSDFQALLQNVYDAALVTDLKGLIVSSNVRAAQFFLSTEQGLFRNNIISLISGANEELLQTIWETLQSDRFVLIQACCIRKDASIFPAEISVNRLTLSGTDYLSFFIRDVTLRKESEDRLRTGYNAIQNAGSGIAIADIHANLQYCNPAMLRLLGLEYDEEILGRNLRDFLAEEKRADQMAGTVAAREPWFDEIEMKRKDGATFVVQMSALPNFNADGELVGMVFSVLDITSLKRTQKQLETYAQELADRNAQMEADLNMAREIQMAFLPRTYPVYPHHASMENSAVRFSHLYLPSGAVGGDFFDVIDISETQVGVFISDVVGHGMRAALVVATTRGLIERLSSVAHDPGAFLTQLNQAYASIFSQMGDRLFATALYFVADTATGLMRYANAGHPSPFRLRRDVGEVETLQFQNGSKGPALGLFDNTVFHSDECRLAPRDLLLLYTDGLSETQNARSEYYETERLAAAVKKNMALSPAELLAAIVADAQDFSGLKAFEDDVCLLAMEMARLGAK